MNLSKILEIDESELNEVNKLLKKNSAISGYGSDEILRTYSVSFENKIRADFDIQNTEDGPYVNAMLFDDGNEVGLIEPMYELDGKYSFEYKGNEYSVEILPK